MRIQTFIVGALLALSGCGEQNPSSAKSDTGGVEAAAANTALNKEPEDNAAAKVYAQAKKCLIDVSMRTMTDNPSGPPSVNRPMFDAFKQEMVTAGSRLGKTQSQVIDEFRQLVTEEASTVDAMSQVDKGRYIRTTNASAIQCMERQKRSITEEIEAKQ